MQSHAAMRPIVLLGLCIVAVGMWRAEGDWRALAAKGAVIVGVAVCTTLILRSEDAVEIARLRTGESEHDRRDDDDDDKRGPSAPSDGAAEAA